MAQLLLRAYRPSFTSLRAVGSRPINVGLCHRSSTPVIFQHLTLGRRRVAHVSPEAVRPALVGWSLNQFSRAGHFLRVGSWPQQCELRA